ncbi:hypothetical protein [Serratia nevei]|uniref:hypothetical protein n=1 Tax=Serratia nevei TaxID=2703794 RepID=UPI0036A48222
MDKFSELKAAAAKYSAALNAHRENPTDKGALYAWDEAITEFSSAIGCKEMEIIIALLAELEAKDKRIGELEVIATEYAGKFQKAQDANKHLIIMSNDDKKRIAELEAEITNIVDSHAETVAELRAKLATPVRLLGEMLPHEWEIAERQAAFEHRKIAWDARLAEDKKAILAAGFTFTVEGDK